MVNLYGFKNDAEQTKTDGSAPKKVAYMVLELIEGGEFFDYVAVGKFSPEVCRYYFQQMLQVMHYMHINSVAHRDLKPENIFVDEKFNIRFADFGFSTYMQGDGSGHLKTILGTTAYMSPQLLTKVSYKGQDSDLFALGIILFIMYTGHPPFNCAHPQTDPHYQLIAQGQADKFWAQHSKSKPQGFFPEDFKDLISNMLQLDPNHRLSLADCVGHAWMQGPIAQAQNVRNEFAQRARTIKENAEAEARAASASRPQARANRPVRALKTEESKDNLPDLNLQKFDNKNVFALDTVLYSTFRPDDLLNLFEEVLKDRDIQTYQKDDKKCKLTFETYKE